MLKSNNFLIVFVFLFLLVGCAGAERPERTEVEIYRKSTVSADETMMRDFCRNLEQDPAPTGPQSKTETEIYRKEPAPGVSEYHRKYSESNRYPDSAQKSRMLQLCRQIERDSRFDE